MTRIYSAVPFAAILAAISAPVFAGPTISPQGPGDGGAPVSGAHASLALECQINGRSETFVITGGTLADRPGIVTRLDLDIYAILTDRGRILLTGDSAQITDGPDAGKWDCVSASLAPPPTADPGTTDAGDPGALEASQEELITAIGERDAARLAVVEAENRAVAALAENEVLLTELAASLHMEETAQAALARTGEDLAERDAELSEALRRIRAGELERAELEAALAAAEEANAALSAELTAMMQAGGDMPDQAADQGAPVMFDADAALAMLAAADIGDIARAALTAAVEQARENPDLAAEVMTRLENALGQ